MLTKNNLTCTRVIAPAVCIDENGIIMNANQGVCQLSGYHQTEITRLAIGEIITTYPANEAISTHYLHTHPEGELQLIHKNGNLIPVNYYTTYDTEEHCFITFFDLSSIKKTEEKLMVQLERMQALGDIDRAIISSMDISQITEVVFDQINQQLEMDCCILFLLDSNSKNMICKHTRGLSSLNNNWTNQPSSMLAEVVATRSEMFVTQNFRSDLHFSGELPFPYNKIKFYAGIPLYNLDEVIGVLEVCSQEIFYPDKEWEFFFKMLAGQTAIAIVHVNQFHNIRRLNTELLQSYESTLKGWARVLEFKDSETQGHSDRVTQMAVQLGEAMGLTTEELVHIRRGAVLHDIGKLCIPENILLKAGPLDDAEWDIMKQHPVYAQEFVADIQFLQPATDILLFHHERWDGSGYPLGLEDTQIPLSARIFMVIDVWDALSYDRPYREAWPPEKVREYLHNNAGILFDPEVVETFLEIIS